MHESAEKLSLEALPGCTHLHIAAANGDCTAMRNLLARTNDVDAVDAVRGATPLVWASAYGHPEAAALLLGAGANPDATDTIGYTSLYYALNGFTRGNVVWNAERAARASYRKLCLLLLHTALRG